MSSFFQSHVDSPASAWPSARRNCPMEELKQREKTIPPQGKIRLPEALDRLIESTATKKPDDVKKWQAVRAKYPGPVKKSPMPREVK